MPNHARTHDEAREVVCVLCLKKSLEGRVPSVELTNEIRSFIPDFSVENSSYPKKVCDDCHFKLIRGELISQHHYEDLMDYAPSAGNCSCKICEVARSNPRKKQKRGRPKESDQENIPFKVCPICFSKMSPGKPHLCNTRQKVKNLVAAAGKEKEQVAALIIADKLQAPSTSSASGSSQVISMKRSRGIALNIAVVNKKAKLDLESPPPVIDVNVLKSIQIDTGANLNKMRLITRNLRSTNKSLVKRGALKALNDSSHDLDKFFNVETMVMDVGKDTEGSTSIVFCQDLNQLVSFLLDKRGIDDDFFIKIGMDGGGDSLKVGKSFIFCHSCNGKGLNVIVIVIYVIILRCV